MAVFGARAAAHPTNAVYEWCRYGGADPDGAAGHGSGNHGWSPTYGGWYRGGPSHVVRTPTPVRGIDGTVRQIASSNSDGYGLTTGGRVYAWGAGAQGELGNGTTPTLSRRAVRVDFPAGVVIERLADPMPFGGGMAIDTHGRVWAWGNDQRRQFCQPRGADLETPVRVPLSYVTLAAGAQMHAVYDAGGTVVSCGLSDFGLLGDGATGRSLISGTPVAVKGPAGRPGRRADLKLRRRRCPAGRRQLLRLGLQPWRSARGQHHDRARDRRASVAPGPRQDGLSGRQHDRQRTDDRAALRRPAVGVGQWPLRAALSTRSVRDPLDVAQVSSTANVVVALGRRGGSVSRVGHAVKRRPAAA